MINSFETLFEARERRQQIERIYRGESVDLVAKITTDGVLDNLDDYQISGIYQATLSAGDTKFYEIAAEIKNNKAIVHWTYNNDWGASSYQIWALLKKLDEEAYPVSWRLDLAYSPSYPISPAPDPLPKSLDFAEYTLVNAPWLPARQTNIGYDVDTDVQINGDLSANEIRIGSEPLSGAIVEAVDTAVRESIGTVDGKIDSISGDIAGVHDLAYDTASYITSTVNGLPAVISKIQDVDNHVEGNNEILNDIKSTVDGITIPTDYAKEATVQGVATNAQTAATYAQANNNLLTSPNGLVSIHATVKSKASQTSVNAIGTKVDSIKSTVEGITIPTDYAKEATLTAVGQTVDDTNTRTHSIYQYIDGVIYPLGSNINYQVNGLRDGTHPINAVLADIQQDGQATNTTVNAINNVVSNGTYGNSAIKTAVDAVGTNVTSVKTTVEDNNDKLGDLATALDIINGEVL